MKNYKAIGLHAEDTENGKFKVVETKILPVIQEAGRKNLLQLMKVL